MKNILLFAAPFLFGVFVVAIEPAVFIYFCVIIIASMVALGHLLIGIFGDQND